MTATTHIECSRLSQPEFLDLPDELRVRMLGLTCIGEMVPGRHDAMPVQTVFAPLLGDAVALNEAWIGSAPCRSGEAEEIRYRCDDSVLYGVIELEESRFAGAAMPLQDATEEAYRRIFTLLDRAGYPFLWRVWNYLPEINVVRQGLERYRHFNVGRHDAFVAAGRLEDGLVPAACALGTRHGPLTVAFMAGRNPAVPVENPRQVSAYRYPAAYGPRSPTFSRAALARLPGQELLFISGTASIVGHQTMHPGDVAAQTRETMANIAALLDEVNRQAYAAPYRLSDLRFRTYVRHAQDFPRVRDVLAGEIGADAPVLYIQADICRADLLIEIEAMASHSLGNC